jgi:hypothetical protein
MLTYADVCCRMLPYAFVCLRMLAYACVCLRMLYIYIVVQVEIVKETADTEKEAIQKQLQVSSVKQQ